MKIAPSILSADFSILKDEIKEIEAGQADWVHIDVMDGQFVPNLTFGACVVEHIRPHTTMFFDVHLMVNQPEKYIESFVKAGADLITVHVEATTHVHRTLELIHKMGVKAGIALNPGTPICMIDEVLDMVDMVLIMTVNPGFGGQKFITSTLDKIKALKQKNTGNFLIEVDGGINLDTISLVEAAGADVSVAGSAIFGQKDRKTAIMNLKNAKKI